LWLRGGVCNGHFIKVFPKTRNLYLRVAGDHRVVGLNWWHFGGGHSMSHRMRNSINKADLGSKPYK
jgi:hypothetical protein